MSDSDTSADTDADMPDAVEAAAEDEIEAAMAAMEAADRDDRDDRPDPSTVASATKEGILNQRDDGEPITDTEVVETAEGWRTMEFGRPSATLMMWFEEQGSDIGTGEFAEVYARLIEDPDLTPDEWRTGDLTAYVDLIEISMSRLESVMQSDFVTEVQTEIGERSGEATGN